MISRLKILADYRCNLACPHCVQNVSRQQAAEAVRPDAGQPMRLADLGRFLGDLCDAAPGMAIYLSGGEPFASAHWFRCARLICDLGLRFKTISNGTLLQAVLDEILRVHPESIAFTFNGIRETHDRVVGVAGSFARMSAGLRRCAGRLLEHGIAIEATYVMTGHGDVSIRDGLQSIADIPFRKCVLQHVSFLEAAAVARHRDEYRRLFGAESTFVFGEGADRPAVDPGVLCGQIREVLRSQWPFEVCVFPPLVEEDELADYYGPAPQIYRARRCRRFQEELWILPDGTITSCFAHPFGHVATHRLGDILGSTEYRRWCAVLCGLEEPLPGCCRCHRIHADCRARVATARHATQERDP